MNTHTDGELHPQEPSNPSLLPKQMKSSRLPNSSTCHNYVTGISGRIEWKCRNLGIRMTFKSREPSGKQTKEPQAEWKGSYTRYHVLSVKGSTLEKLGEGCRKNL